MSSGLSSNYATSMCFTQLVVSKCIRTSICLILSVITFIICIIQAFRTIKITKQKFSPALLLIYFAIIQNLLGIFHWSYFISTIFNYFMIYFKLLQLCDITYFFCTFALKLSNLQSMTNKILAFFVVIVILETVAVIVISVESDQNHSQECLDKSFVILDSSGLFLTVLFMVVGLFVIWKLKKQSVSESIRKKKKMDIMDFNVILFNYKFGECCMGFIS